MRIPRRRSHRRRLRRRVRGRGEDRYLHTHCVCGLCASSRVGLIRCMDTSYQKVVWCVDTPIKKWFQNAKAQGCLSPPKGKAAERWSSTGARDARAAHWCSVIHLILFLIGPHGSRAWEVHGACAAWPPGGTCAKVTHFGVNGAIKCTRVQMRSKHAKVADGRHPPTKAAAACARA